MKIELPDKTQNKKYCFIYKVLYSRCSSPLLSISQVSAPGLYFKIFLLTREPDRAEAPPRVFLETSGRTKTSPNPPPSP